MTGTAVPDPEAGPEPSFLPHPAMDHMLDALVALSAELWAERDRRRVLEQVLARRGLLDAAELEAFRQSDSEQAAREQDRDAYVRRVFGALKTL
jgi:hypothetical protein